MFPHINHPPALGDDVTPCAGEGSQGAERLNDLLVNLMWTPNPCSVCRAMLPGASSFSYPESG